MMLMLRLSIVIIVSRDNGPLPKGPENIVTECILLILYRIQELFCYPEWRRSYVCYINVSANLEVRLREGAEWAGLHISSEMLL
jgi:hypothetical protein